MNRSGNASKLKVGLVYEPAGVSLKVADDGCGFDVSATAATDAGHFGLLGMRERTDKMGGTLEIVSRPGTGTVITLKVPVKVGEETENP